MGTLLIHHAAVLVTMDAERREIQEGGLFIRDGVIEQVGPAAALPVTADEVLNLSGYIVFPGLVNTHHHLHQTLTRAVPAAQDAPARPDDFARFPRWTSAPHPTNPEDGEIHIP